MKRTRKRIILYAGIVVLLAVLGYSLYRFLSIQKDYREERIAHEQLYQYRPQLPDWDDRSPADTNPSAQTATEDSTSQDGSETHNNDTDPTEPSASPDEPKQLTNKSIVRLREDYPAAVGWIIVPGTDVDYPFVQGKDNDYYLRRGIDGKYLYAGVPFMDYRCAPDFSGENTILFGHNLRNGTMFGTLSRFKEQSFFTEHRYFYVFLEHSIIRAEIIACLVVTPNQAPYVFEPEITSDFPETCIRQARCAAAGLSFSATDRFITLATCDYEKNDSRVILIGRIRD